VLAYVRGAARAVRMWNRDSDPQLLRDLRN